MLPTGHCLEGLLERSLKKQRDFAKSAKAYEKLTDMVQRSFRKPFKLVCKKRVSIFATINTYVCAMVF